MFYERYLIVFKLLSIVCSFIKSTDGDVVQIIERTLIDNWEFPKHYKRETFYIYILIKIKSN